jgi:hypothetical protein
LHPGFVQRRYKRPVILVPARAGELSRLPEYL